MGRPGAQLRHLCVIDGAGTLLLSYYMDRVPPEERDDWEAALAEATRPLWDVGIGEVHCTTCEGHPVVLRSRRELLFILTGSMYADELARA
jgi:hypothetical protein